MTDRRPKLIQRMEEKREAFQERGRVYRAMWVAAGAIVTAAGLALLLLPGPAFVVIPIGLAMLSLEFAWAERLLDSTLERGVEAKDRAIGATRRQKIVGIAAIVCALAAAGAVGLLYLT